MLIGRPLEQQYLRAIKKEKTKVKGSEYARCAPLNYISRKLTGVRG